MTEHLFNFFLTVGTAPVPWSLKTDQAGHTLPKWWWKWGPGWTEEMNGKCLCLSCSLGLEKRGLVSNSSGPKGPARRRLLSGDCSIYTSCVSTAHLNLFFLSSCSVTYSRIHWKWANTILCDSVLKRYVWGMIRGYGNIREGNVIQISDGQGDPPWGSR